MAVFNIRRIRIGMAAFMTGPGAFTWLTFAARAAMLSTRDRRSASYAANADVASGRSRRHRASSTALSIASDAPWPDELDGAWTASPTRTIRPRYQFGTG